MRPLLARLIGDELTATVLERLPGAGEPVETDDSSRAWASSGGLALTGRFNGASLEPQGGVATFAEVLGVLLARFSAALGDEITLDGPALLGERAALAGLGRAGDISCGGSARLIRCRDGWAAVSLPRPSDVASLEAWLETEPPRSDPWVHISAELARRPVHPVVDQARLLGLPVARVGEEASRPPTVGVTSLGDARLPGRSEALVVVDLSSLWAGPLCAQLLHQAGATVIKVEAIDRPDGARRGPRRFYDLLHAGHLSVGLDFRTAEGRAALTALLARADVVIEASRPRALRQLGIDPRSIASAGRLAAWVSITGYGRAPHVEDRVAFGDDGAAAGGLVAWDDAGPCFVADAVADPLTGLLAATTALAALVAGGTWLLDCALARTAAAAASWPRSGRTSATPVAELTPAAPRARPLTGSAAPLGADTAPVLSWLRVGGTAPAGCATSA